MAEVLQIAVDYFDLNWDAEAEQFIYNTYLNNTLAFTMYMTIGMQRNDEYDGLVF